jgi:hypothetical protein
MNMRKLRRELFCAGLTAVVALLAGASPSLDMEALLREADAAYQNKDFARAADLYEKAEARTTDPGMVALNRAAAKFRLAQASDSPADLLEAEQLYRCCTSEADPRRPQALYGLGNCLLLKAGERDAAAARAAIDCFQLCLHDKHTDAALAADARHNLEQARLLALQIHVANSRPPSEPPGGEDPQRDLPRPDRTPPTDPIRSPGNDMTGQDHVGTPVKPQLGDAPRGTDSPRPPGKGSLPPIPDQSEPSPLSPKDAADYLEKASRAIEQDRQANRQRNARTPAPGVRDW